MTLPRPRGPHSREQNYVLPERCFPRIASLPLRTWRPFIQSSNGTALGLVGVGIALPNAGNRPRLERRRFRISDQHPGLVAINGCAATFNSLRSELAGDPAQDEAESLGSVASIISPVRHGNHDGAADVSEAGKEGPEAGSENECCD